MKYYIFRWAFINEKNYFSFPANKWQEYDLRAQVLRLVKFQVNGFVKEWKATIIMAAVFFLSIVLTLNEMNKNDDESE